MDRLWIAHGSWYGSFGALFAWICPDQKRLVGKMLQQDELPTRPFPFLLLSRFARGLSFRTQAGSNGATELLYY